MFKVDNNSSEGSLKYFMINSESDFIQKDVVIKNIEVTDGTFGKQLKVTVGKDEAEAYQWVAQEPGEDKELPSGKTLTKDQQVDNVIKVIAHIGRRFLGEGFKASGATFDEVVNDLVKQTKDMWPTTKLNAKFEINSKGYAGLAKYVPFLEKEGEDKLYVSIKDKQALAEKLSVSPDTETESSETTDVF